MLVYSDMILLDLAGPLTALNVVQADIQLIARSPQAVMIDVGLPVTPTASFETPRGASTCCSCRAAV